MKFAVYRDYRQSYKEHGEVWRVIHDWRLIAITFKSRRDADEYLYSLHAGRQVPKYDMTALPNNKQKVAQ